MWELILCSLYFIYLFLRKYICPDLTALCRKRIISKEVYTPCLQCYSLLTFVESISSVNTVICPCIINVWLMRKYNLNFCHCRWEETHSNKGACFVFVYCTFFICFTVLIISVLFPCSNHYYLMLEILLLPSFQTVKQRDLLTTWAVYWMYQYK